MTFFKPKKSRLLSLAKLHRLIAGFNTLGPISSLKLAKKNAYFKTHLNGFKK